MNTLIHSTLLPFLGVLVFTFSFVALAGRSHEDFLQCLSLSSDNTLSISTLVYAPSTPSYSSVLEFTIQNLRFNTSSTPKPLVIVTPTKVTEAQATVSCSRKHNMRIRIRSGGHDYEGLSYVAPLPFVVLDLINLRTITIDVGSNTAWVQSGATLGELYYQISQKSRTLAFPAGVCPTVGVGGHFSGGGYGLLFRKYGLAADNIIDALIIDAKGNVRDRASMGEDHFWAIRGGGGNTFGVVIAWKLRLVQVPPTVTLFSVPRTVEQNATNLIYRWQFVGKKLPQDLMLQVILSKSNTTGLASFNALFLGGVDRLLPLMQERFPELGLVKEDCREMSWIEAQVTFATSFASNVSLNVLINRNSSFRGNFKGKSDYVMTPITEKALEGIWENFRQLESVNMVMTPYGGKMSEISPYSIPFPHRAGVLYEIGYAVAWIEGTSNASQRYIGLTRKLYNYMTPYVSKNPRAAYVNYRDLDIGMNNEDYTSYRQARVWGIKYFGNNFDRLVHVKTKVDPTNFFRNEQSVPAV
ncbi:hypothetical protein K2173_001784 [Erythroxylum novogranatense]|uniref:FAD-binding PCMH-type domain-containing protein n=1 Tax=Erythroxylum novogranatense TaxID=1862640 RepID=A0AAV8SJ45_9ROSI|nr:hypothetical protein K2173_001784 [Erythroxylum novogranatense]